MRRGKDEFKGFWRAVGQLRKRSPAVLVSSERSAFVLLISKRFSVRVRFILCSWELCKLRQRLSPDVSVLAEPIVNAPSRISSMNPCLRLSQTSVPVDWLFRGCSCHRRLRALLAAFLTWLSLLKGILCLIAVGFYYLIYWV